MDTGRFKMVQPEQVIRDERKRVQVAAEARAHARSQMGRRTRVSKDRTRTRAVDNEGMTAEEQSIRRARRQNLEQTSRRPSPLLLLLAVALIAAAIFAAHLCSSATPINVTVNGTQYTLRGAKTLQTAIKESGVPLNPGDYISLKGTVLKRHEGNPFYATVNDAETLDPDYQLHDGDTVVLSDGKDIVEEYDAVEEPVPYGVSIRGTGAIHTFEEGADGVKEIRTGRESGEVVEKQTVEPQDLVETCFNVDVGQAKVIALTFDDGPSAAFTEDILDILAQNDAKATFFCVGTAIEDGGVDIVRRAAEQGCQICSHSYNNAQVVKGDFSLLSADEQVEEVQKGLQAIADALGSEPSRYVRVGSESMKDFTIPNVAPLIDAEIGWTLDTGDWVYMTEDDIYGVLMSAKAGDIVRMHDGGDHQNVTAAALKRALPKLKEKGFTFVTIDELMVYEDA